MVEEYKAIYVYVVPLSGVLYMSDGISNLCWATLASQWQEIARDGNRYQQKNFKKQTGNSSTKCHIRNHHWNHHWMPCIWGSCLAAACILFASSISWRKLNLEGSFELSLEWLLWKEAERISLMDCCQIPEMYDQMKGLPLRNRP